MPDVTRDPAIRWMMNGTTPNAADDDSGAVMGWLIVIGALIVLLALYVWSRRGRVRQKSIDDAHSRAMTHREPRPPADGSQVRL